MVETRYSLNVRPQPSFPSIQKHQRDNDSPNHNPNDHMQRERRSHGPASRAAVVVDDVSVPVDHGSVAPEPLVGRRPLCRGCRPGRGSRRRSGGHGLAGHPGRAGCKPVARDGTGGAREGPAPDLDGDGGARWIRPVAG